MRFIYSNKLVHAYHLPGGGDSAKSSTFVANTEFTKPFVRTALFLPIDNLYPYTHLFTMTVAPVLQKQHLGILSLCGELKTAIGTFQLHNSSENKAKVLSLVSSFVGKSWHHLSTEDNHTYPIALSSGD